MDERLDSHYLQWATTAVTRQPGDLRAYWHAAHDRRNANAGERSIEKAMNIDFPYHFDNRGRTAAAADEKHIRNLIEQVLFTSPGERVNRPTFGSGLLQMVFEPNSDELAATLQLLVQGSLQQWLGDLISVESVQVETEDATLRVSVGYIIRRTQTRATAEFTKGSIGA